MLFLIFLKLCCKIEKMTLNESLMNENAVKFNTALRDRMRCPNFITGGDSVEFGGLLRCMSRKMSTKLARNLLVIPDMHEIKLKQFAGNLEVKIRS